MTYKKNSYKFVKYVFNQCFNEFIKKYISDKTRVGITQTGGNTELGLYNYGRYYFDAVELDNLRNKLLQYDSITHDIAEETIFFIAKIFVSTKREPELKRNILKFIRILKTRYGWDFYKTFWRDIKELEKVKHPVNSEPKSKSSSKFKKLLKALLSPISILVLIIIVAILIIYQIRPLVQNITPANETKQEFTKTNVTEEVPIEISLRNYLVNWAEYDNKEITLEGYLQNDIEGTKQGGIYVDSVIDDFGRSIPLRMLTQEQKALFVKKGTTKDVYKITGMLKRKYPSVELIVSKIVPTARQMTTVTREVTLGGEDEAAEETPQQEPKKEGFSFDKVWTGILSFFDSISEGVKEMKLEEKGSKLVDQVSEIAKSGSEVVEATFEEIRAPPESVSDKTKEIEQAILEYTNAERKSQGLGALSWDGKLADVARTHSLDMVENDFFAHTNLKGEDPSARAAHAGYNAYKALGGGYYSIGVAENIGKMPTGNVEGIGYVSSNPDSIARAQVSSWMDSSGHRSNILNPQYDVIGVGVAYDGLYYVATQNFK